MPFLRYDDWWIRGFDYPRQQLIFILGLAALCWVISAEADHWINLMVSFALIAAAFYQAYRILPYSPLHAKDARPAQRLNTSESHLSLMISNVLQTNRRSDLVIEQVKQNQPDILVTVETNSWWEQELEEGIGEDYPHRVNIPLENLYGMHLWSKYELIDPQVRYRIKDDIPSIDTSIQLESGRQIYLYFVHPMPPSPSEAYASTGRDAELALVGSEVREYPDRTTIVAGDLNDVAWSHSTRLFQRISGLVDPRRGRGLFSTFHAEYRLARWPLDHVFISTDLTVIHLEKLPYVGSDHFPVYIELSYEPEKDENQGEQPDRGDLREADHTIELGRNGTDHTALESE